MGIELKIFKRGILLRNFFFKGALEELKKKKWCFQYDKSEGKSFVRNILKENLAINITNIKLYL